MNRKQKIIVSITGITLVLLILVGLTYAYFLTRIQGNTNQKSISVTTANLALVYGDGNGYIHAELIEPGTVLTSKTFTVTNEGNKTTTYGVFLEDLYNDFKYTNDLKLEVTCTSSVSGKTCNGYTGIMPTNNDLLITNSIDPAGSGVQKEVQTYALTLRYEETGTDQSDDMNKSAEAKVQIYDLNNTVDLSGVVTGSSSGDYVLVNSNPKKSYIRNNTFKVVGLEPGSHRVEIYGSNDVEPKYEETITINKGTTESINGSTVTITNETRIINTSIDISNDALSVDSTSINPYRSGTLAYSIINNAENVTDQEISNHYAELSLIPKTQPALQINTVDEGTISATEDDYGISYYYRGNVVNNYVNFAGLCWRIVRVEGDGSVKLLLEDSTYECNNPSYDGNWTIGDTISFGYDSNNKADFLNNSQGKLDNKTGLAEELESYQSTLLSKIRTKYTSKELADYLKVDEWCYDHNVTETSGSDEHYGAYTRIYTNKQPSNVCTGTKISKYGDNTTDMYVGTLTADEVVFAGGIFSSNTNYYIMNTYAQNNNLRWWALSPSDWVGEGGSDIAFYVSSNGYLYSTNVGYGYSRVARPAVTLKAGTVLSGGIGTQASPYVIN